MIYRSENHECWECPCSYLDHTDLWCEHYALAEKLTNAKNSEPICPDTGIRPDCPLPVVTEVVDRVLAESAEIRMNAGKE